MSIKGIFVCPHGDSILEPQKVEAYAVENQIIHESMKKICDSVSNIRPHLVLLITPHGQALSENHCLYLNQFGFGNVDPPDGTIEQQERQSASVDIDSELSQKMLSFFKQKHQKVEGITAFGESLPITLAWAEVIPLWFLQKYSKHIDFKLIILSVSNRRKTEANQMVSEMKDLGSCIYEFFQTQVNPDKRVVIVNSCDLAHTFKITHGPDMGKEPYGVSPDAQPFDDYIQNWAIRPNSELGQQYLYEKAAQIIMTALSCGFCGLVTISQIIEKLAGKKNDNNHNQIIQLQQNYSFNMDVNVFCNLHPTYFGMMVAQYLFSLN